VFGGLDPGIGISGGPGPRGGTWGPPGTTGPFGLLWLIPSTIPSTGLVWVDIFLPGLSVLETCSELPEMSN
jgi:hypothetical protein